MEKDKKNAEDPRQKEHHGIKDLFKSSGKPPKKLGHRESQKIHRFKTFKTPGVK